MGNFTFEEMNLLCIYNTNTGSRTELIEALTEMRGELSPEEKDRISHRGKALRELVTLLEAKEKA